MRKLRGHHLICLHFYDGEGYDEPFIRNLESVLADARGEGVRVADGPDDVCTPCPHRRGERCTLSPEADREIREMDGRARALLGIEPGAVMQWGDLRERAFEGFSRWQTMYCFGCTFRPVCEKNELYRRLRDGDRP